MASPSTALLTVSEVISRLSRIGTPDRRSTDRVWANRLRAVRCTTRPKIGVRSFSVSQIMRPRGVRTNRRPAKKTPKARPTTTGKYEVKMFEILISINVGAGRVPPTCLYMLLNMGTTKISMPVAMPDTRTSTATG